MLLTRSLALLLLALPAAAQTELSYLPQPGPVRHLGTYHLATGTWSRSQPQSSFAPDAVYRNDAPTGYFGTGWEGCWTLDEGILPGPTHPAGGSQDAYTIEGLDFSYCKLGAGTIDWTFGFLSAYTPCDSMQSPSECMVEVPGPIVVAGLPGGSACWTLTIDLSGGAEVCLAADGGTCTPGYQGGHDQSDHAGLCFGWRTSDGALAGPLLTGDPNWMPRGEGTCYRPGFSNGCGATVATGLGAQDIFATGDHEAFGFQCTYVGCHFFGGYKAGLSCGATEHSPFAGFPFVLYADCAATCSPTVFSYCGPDQNPANTAKVGISTIYSSASSVVVRLFDAPPNQFCYLLVGDGNATISQPPGSVGDLCVAGGACLGRYSQDAGSTGFGGKYAIDIKAAASSPCNGGVVIAPGSTWHFQYWHRQAGGQPSTFSDALEVRFE